MPSTASHSSAVVVTFVVVENSGKNKLAIFLHCFTKVKDPSGMYSFKAYD